MDLRTTSHPRVNSQFRSCCPFRAVVMKQGSRNTAVVCTCFSIEGDVTSSKARVLCKGRYSGGNRAVQQMVFQMYGLRFILPFFILYKMFFFFFLMWLAVV